MKVLHITGYQSDKLGSLERFWVALARSSPGTHSFLFFNSNLHPDISGSLRKYGRILQPGGKSQIFDIARAIYVMKPDIINVHFTPSAYIAGILVFFIPGVKVVWTKHSMSKIKTLKNVCSHNLMKIICRNIIAVSAAVKNELVNNFGFDTDIITVVHVGIDTDYFTSFAKEINNKDPLILTVSQMVEEKGIDVLIDAAGILKDRGIRANFKIAGKGPLLEKYKQYAKTKGIDNMFNFLGQVDNIKDLMPKADIFVLPSRSEGMPFALLEAMASGKSVVATNVGGVPEAVVNGYNGILVDKDNAEAIANGIISLLKSPYQAVKLGSSATATVEKEFNLQKMVDGFNKVYSEII